MNESTAAQAISQPARKKEPFVEVFMRGATKGWNMAIKNMFPAVILAYTVIKILTDTGILDVIGKVFDPVMAIFGLPGVAITCIVTGLMTRPGGLATGLALIAAGTLTNRDVTILIAPIMMVGGCLGQYVRVLVVSGVNPRARKYILVISFVMAFASMWLMNIILKLMGM